MKVSGVTLRNDFQSTVLVGGLQLIDLDASLGSRSPELGTVIVNFSVNPPGDLAVSLERLTAAL
ncbi:uncharacterized protein N7498_010181 [Penicillium cinerascens]|uniref:Uncharacterized protein n=1 Tax=Penicillium cinerascens TaxID=70096 RepID=A0A9W9J8H0_9EURO|nr:uncharacterized protein N7498_010181 [Penicillium cinerascens]KAJ5191196.1 hypothetical protein N7498_010181 [Penicillium cinerascens]